MARTKQKFLFFFLLCIWSLQAEEYCVQKGDSLYRIAKKYGTSVAELKRLNNLSSNKLSIGQTLLVSAVERQTEDVVQSGSRYQAARTYHRVRRGETLLSIARKYGLSVDQLRQLNQISGYLIKPGQRLLISVSWSRETKPTEPVLEIAEETPSETELKLLSSLPPENKITRVIENALGFLGTPYRFGGTGRSGIDCSGLVKKVFGGVGVQLPRTACQQYQEGTVIDKDDLAAGDLLFFSRLKNLRPTHVALYLGNGLILHASRKARKVVIESFDKANYLQNQFVGARRIIEEENQQQYTVTP